MATNISFYNLKLVKEASARYEVPRKISSPNDIYRYATDVIELDTFAEEYFYIIGLNSKNLCTGIFRVSHGNLNSSIVHPREVFKRALLNNCSSIILLHNHPSGVNTPSREDKQITNRIVEGGELLGVKVLDHIIVGEESFFSFKAEDMLD